MVTKKKPFINKKKAVKFHLAHEPADSPNAEFISESFTPENHDNWDDHAGGNEFAGEAVKYGIFFEDQHEYNYLKHLKEIGRSPNAVWIEAKQSSKEDIDKSKRINDAGSSIAEVETEHPFSDILKEIDEAKQEGGIEVAEEEIEDLDIIEALKALEDDAYLNEFEDDFVKDINNVNESEGESDEEYYSEEEEEESGQVSSSAIGNTKRTMFDENFDKFVNEYYDDSSEEYSEDYEEEEFQGNHGDSDDNCSVTAYETIHKTINDYDLDNIHYGPAAIDEIRNELRAFTLAQLESSRLSADKKQEFEYHSIHSKALQWDCESVWSVTSSTLENRPRVIAEMPMTQKQKLSKIKISHKTGFPLGVFHNQHKKQSLDCVKEDEEEKEKEEEEEHKVTISRSKNESAEEKKARKQAIKEERKLRRMEKKCTKEAFKKEKMRLKN